MERLLQLTLSGSVMALLLILLRRLLGRKLPSTVLYYAWLLVLLRFVLPLPGLIPSLAPADPAAGLVVHAREVSQEPGEEPEISVPGEESEAAPAGAVPVLTLPAKPAGEAGAAAGTSAGREAPRPDWRSPRLWLSLWALGAALCFGFTLLSYAVFTARLRRTLRRPDAFTRAVYASVGGAKPALWRSEAVKTPLTYGLLLPRIVLPAQFYDEPELRNIFAHELTHCRRHDTLFKWFAAAALSLHWFNPLSYVIRREIDSACELSCDEALLSAMDREAKLSYGNTLLSMAASAALPAGVVATTFATEKKNLKERLEQIMHYKKSGARAIAAVLALLLLAGCGMAAGPKMETGEEALPVAPDTDNLVRVETVDELLAAIAPNTTVELAEGVYELEAAASYGADSGSQYWDWSPVYDGFELKIHDVENLTISGAGADKVTLSAAPRYANVLAFSSCRSVTLSGFTAGHTREPGSCAGGVVRFESSNDCAVRRCGLFGCGIIGVAAVDCTGLTVESSDIYECSIGAVNLNACRNVRVTDCTVHDCGVKPDRGEAMFLFDVQSCDSVEISGCTVEKNAAQGLLSSSYSKSVAFLSNEVSFNRFAGVFALQQYPVTVDGCRFDNEQTQWYLYSEGIFANDLEGKALSASALADMEYREIDPASAVPAAAPVQTGLDVPAGAEIRVSTVDEFLAAIGPERTILLEKGLFDLSTASDYGSVGGQYYFWHEEYDGPELIIDGVTGLTIKAAADDPKATTISAVPRYADVLEFHNCDNISLIGFTAGHTKEPGSCSGGVLYFQDCGGISVDACHLYGCGILGVQTQNCSSFQARDCEIYECSQGAASMWKTDGIKFVNCDVHDVPDPAFRFIECGDKTWNGEPLTGTTYFLEDGKLTNVDETAFEPENDLSGMSIVELDASGRSLADGERERFPFPESGKELAFAQSAQQLIAAGDWEKLADRMYFPMMIFTDGANYTVESREEFLAADLDAVLTPAFRERVGKAVLDDMGINLLGNTAADDCIVFAHDSVKNADTILIHALIVRE